MSLRDTFVAQREAKLAEAKAIVETAEVEGRDISDDELAMVKEARAAADALDERITELEAIAAAESRSVVKTTASVQVTSEPSTYRKNGEHSYFRDLASAQMRGDREALDRLTRNDREVRAINTTDTSGGEFVPPLWLVDEYVRLARASRVAADLVRNLPLPAGTDSINLPRITTGAAVATQSSQNTGFQEPTWLPPRPRPPWSPSVASRFCRCSSSSSHRLPVAWTRSSSLTWPPTTHARSSRSCSRRTPLAVVACSTFPARLT